MGQYRECLIAFIFLLRAKSFLGKITLQRLRLIALRREGKLDLWGEAQKMWYLNDNEDLKQGGLSDCAQCLFV